MERGLYPASLIAYLPMRYRAEQSGTAYSAETVIRFLQRDIVYVCCMLVNISAHVHYTQISIGIQTINEHVAVIFSHTIQCGVLIKCTCDPKFRPHFTSYSLPI